MPDRIKQNTLTVFLVVSNGFEARVLLRSGVLEKLIENECKIVILSPNPNEEYFKKEFDHESITLELFNVEEYSRFFNKSKAQKLLRIIRLYSPNWRIQKTEWLNNRKFKTREFIKDKAIRWKIVFLVLFYIHRNSKIVRKVCQKIEERLFLPKTHKELFDKFRPQALVVCSPGFSVNHSYIIREAKYFSAKTIVVVSSWDKPNTGGYPGAIPGKILVWSELMKNEICQLADYNEDDAIVTGTPNFDALFNKHEILTRKELFDKYELDINKKLILIGTRTPTAYSNYYVIKLLAEWISENKLACDCQILVRLHPLYYRRRYDNDKYFDQDIHEIISIQNKYQFVKIAFPYVMSDKLMFDLARDDQKELISMIKHSSVVINLLTTMNIEVAILKTPLINILFDPPIKYRKPGYILLGDAAKWSHNARIIRTGYSKVATTEDGLLNCINEAITSKLNNENTREKLLKQECVPDGKAAIRIAEVILGKKLKPMKNN